MSGAGNLALRIAEALKQRCTHQVMPSVALEAGERHLWSAAATSRLPSPERTKTGTMPPDNRLRLDDHQGIHNARRNPIEGGKNQTIEIAEGEPLRRFSSQHIEPMAQRQDLRFELNP
jgi:hypothetical protein